jgi:predicted PhzF superfamily epimerase YddE/YHI9
VPFWREGDMTWIRSSCDGVPPWQRAQADDAPSVDAMAAPDGDDEARQVWAWLDEPRGLVRARVFASRFGVLEDEACGSASMLLCRELGRPLTIVHGQGSIVAVRPGPDDTVELGGRVMPGA